MILEELGVLAEALDLTVGTVDLTNVIDLGVIPDVALQDCRIVIETETIATGDGSDTYQFQVVVSDEAALNTNKEIFSRTITDFEDEAIAAINRNIVDLDIGAMLGNVVDGTKRYLGVLATVSSGATLSINAALAPGKPGTKFNTQLVRSNVGVPS